jgi:hypothetical protein
VILFDFYLKVVIFFSCTRSFFHFLLHLFLHVAGQKKFTLFNLPVVSSVPLTSFLHLLLGFEATYKSHVNFRMPLNWNVFKFSHSPRGLSHFFLHIPGQKNLTFLPPESGCCFLHLLTGLKATYESHVLDESPLNLNKGSFEQLMVGAGVGNEVGSGVGNKVGVLVGNEVGVLVGNPVGETVGSILGVEVGTVLGTALGFELGTKLGALLGTKLGALLGSRLGPELSTTLGERLGF